MQIRFLFFASKHIEQTNVGNRVQSVLDIHGMNAIAEHSIDMRHLQLYTLGISSRNYRKCVDISRN